MITLVQANSADDIVSARELFLEYAASLGFSLCFQSFDEELATLPGRYAPPQGRLLLACVDGNLAGCGALRPLDTAKRICEMKRLYARPAFRGRGLGRKIAIELMRQAANAGYTHMRLDTVTDRMREAVALYRTLGFYEIEPYNEHPIANTMFMEARLGAEEMIATQGE
jgi:putative acetyltransferase